MIVDNAYRKGLELTKLVCELMIYKSTVRDALSMLVWIKIFYRYFEAK